MPRDFSDTSKPIKPPPEPRRRPKQDRSKMMVDSIVEACIRILDREGADRLTTNRIAEVAGVSKASLYRYFPNKEAIVAAVFDQILTGNLARHDEWERQWSKMSLEESVAFLIDLMLSLDRRLVRLHRSFYQAYREVSTQIEIRRTSS